MKKSPVKNQRSADRSALRKEYQKRTGKKWKRHGSWSAQVIQASKWSLMPK